jgi:hypothetical protein
MTRRFVLGMALAVLLLSTAIPAQGGPFRKRGYRQRAYTAWHQGHRGSYHPTPRVLPAPAYRVFIPRLTRPAAAVPSCSPYGCGVSR